MENTCWGLGFDQMSLEHFEGLCLQQGDCSAGSKDVNEGSTKPMCWEAEECPALP